MTFSTDLTASPYNSRWDPSKNYSRILFQPSVGLQSRELNEVQDLFQEQVQRLSDNILAPGSIVSGCNFLFLTPYPYVKLEDADLDGVAVSPSALVNAAVICDATGLKAQVIDSAEGFASSDPDLKTLYVSYLNQGSNGTMTAFTAGDALRVYDSIRNGVEDVTVDSGGSGFANTDSVIAVSALAVTPVTGTIANGDYISNGLGANVQVVAVDSTTRASSGEVVLSVKPRDEDLANSLLTSTAWTVSNGESIVNLANTATALVTGVIGSGFQGLAVTDSVGSLTQALVLNKGFGYTTVPHVTIRSPNNASGYASLSLSPKNYKARVRVSTVSGAVGNGYAFGVNEGVVYLKGAHLRVPPQTIIVSKYDVSPNAVSVCFTAEESIVDHNMDTELNDPAAGDSNGAPGADRLKVVPTLTLIDANTASSNSQYLPLVTWNEGNPYQQRPQTVYSRIGDQMASTVYDQSGDFVIDPFLITSRTSQVNDHGATMDLVVDSGTAYISGYKVSTSTNYTLNIPRSLDVASGEYHTTLTFGNYLVVDELGGTFQFNTGDQVSLYSSPKNFASNSTLVRTQNTDPVGTSMGTARVRGLQLLNGNPGSPDAQYALYLFDVQMGVGKSFTEVQSVSYSGNNSGIADVVRSTASNGASVTTLVDSSLDAVVWRTQHPTVKNSSNTTYQFRSLDQGVSISNSGVVTKSLASTPTHFFPYSGNLSSSQMKGLVLVPTEADLVSSTNATGTWSVNATSNLAVGTGTSAFSDLATGDWVFLWGNSSTSDLKRVTSIANSTSVQFDSEPSFANASVNIARAFPMHIPIPLGSRTGPTASVDSNGNILTIDLGVDLTSSADLDCSLAVDVERRGIEPTPKTVVRKAFVRLSAASNPGGRYGPWCLGVPDVFRLRGVYVGNSTVSNTGVNYRHSHFVDNNQHPDHYGLSWLYLNPGTTPPMGNTDYALVEFDYCTGGSGYYATPSYTQTSNLEQLLLTDRSSLANLTTMMATYEVPEMVTDSGEEYDMLSCLDFRPYAQSSATPGSTPGTAPLDPVDQTTFDGTEKMFPAPDTELTTTIEAFLPRIDTVMIDGRGVIGWREGTSFVDSGSSPTTPPGMMKIADVLVPEYPQIPAHRTVALTELMNPGVVNNSKYQTSRWDRHAVTLFTNSTKNVAKRYTNKDIARIDSRLTAVESVVSLSLLETSVQSLVIPSSADPTVNRFQFGFFADDFTTGGMTDSTNPTYAAELEDGDVVPSKLTFEVYGGDDFNGAFAHALVPVVTQENATTGTTDDANSTPQCAVALANSIAYQLIYRSFVDPTVRPDLANGESIWTPVDVMTVTLADIEHMVVANVAGFSASQVDSASANNTGPGTVTLWFSNYEDQSAKFELVQGNVVVADSSTATSLTAAEVADLTGSSKNYWFAAYGSSVQNVVVSNTGFAQNSGKVVWNYTGLGNTSLTVRTTSGTTTRTPWRWVLSYPINGATAGCVPPPRPVSCPAGYRYDASVGGCVRVTSSGGGGGGGTTRAPNPTVTNIDWTGCGNNLDTLQSQITQAQRSGATIGTITVRGPTGTAQNNVKTSGSLSDWQSPTSSQNKSVLLQEAAWHAQNSKLNNGTTVNLGTNKIARMTYTYDIASDTIYGSRTYGSRTMKIVVVKNTSAALAATSYGAGTNLQAIAKAHKR